MNDVRLKDGVLIDIPVGKKHSKSHMDKTSVLEAKKFPKRNNSTEIGSKIGLRMAKHLSRAASGSSRIFIHLTDGVDTI